MRYIHNVNFHEKFIASGEYVYYENDQLTSQIESWTKHQLPDGSYFIRVDNDSRSTDKGASLLTEALQSADGVIERFDIHLFYSRMIDGVMSLRATYSLEGDYVQIGRFFNNEEREYSEISLSGGSSLLPPGYVFLGDMLSNASSKIEIVQAQYKRDDDPAGKVQINAELLGVETIELNNHPYQTRCFSWQNWKIWVDEYHIPLKMVETDSDKIILLTGYAQGK